MHSLHVNAFFDYLMDTPHPYWSQIPSDPNPICEEGRDGVAAEDDMALRALLPHIRPRRGRRKLDDDGLKESPSQRPRLVSPTPNGDMKPGQPDDADPWTAHSDGRSTAILFPSAEQARSSVITGPDTAFPWHGDVAPYPLTAYPHSAMTPSTGRGDFWLGPAEPQSAITPSRQKGINRRHGAKAVSSAWRAGASGSTGKIRGRPPISRNNDDPIPTPIDGNRMAKAASCGNETRNASVTNSMLPPDPVSSPKDGGASTPPAKPARPGRLSLQVPERAGGSVRLATPPPVVKVNGEAAPQNGGKPYTHRKEPVSARDGLMNGPSNAADPPGSMDQPTLRGSQGHQHHGDWSGGDRGNAEEIESYFVYGVLAAYWQDEKGNRIETCGLDEAMAIVATIIDDLTKQALSKEAFLMNLAALSGGSQSSLSKLESITRLEEGRDSSRLLCKWDLNYGSLRGNHSLTILVPHSRWKRPTNLPKPRGSTECSDDEEGDAHRWRRKYSDLLDMIRARDQQITDLRVKLISSMRGRPELKSV